MTRREKFKLEFEDYLAARLQGLLHADARSIAEEWAKGALDPLSPFIGSSDPADPLEAVQQLYNGMLAHDNELSAASRVPTCDDYNMLFDWVLDCATACGIHDPNQPKGEQA